ncbi:MAG: metallopeptidase TldD-related protein, partial [Polyangiaceae bacterium]
MNGDDLLALAKDALAHAGEADAEIFVRARSRGVARFAIGALGQHMQIEESGAVVRVAKGTRLAEARTSSLDRASILEALSNAARVAAIAPEVAEFPGFASKDDAGDFVSKENHPPRRAASTAGAAAEDRVALLAPALARVKKKGFTSAGVLETSAGAVAVATTRGCERSHDDTVASYRVWALETAGAGGAAGFGNSMHRDLDKVAIEEETDRAISRCELGKNPRALDAGTYDVVFEPAAVCELLEWLGMIAFNASEVEQGTSALAGKIGQAVTGDLVDIRENPVDPSDLGFGAPF